MRLSEKRRIQLPGRWATVLLLLVFTLILLAGWHREIISRHPISDLPFVDQHRLAEQVRSGNVGKSEALFYRKKHAGADTAEIR